MSVVDGAAVAPTLLMGLVNVGQVVHVTAVALGMVLCAVDTPASRSAVTA